MAKYRKKPATVEAFQFITDPHGDPEHWGPVMRKPGEGEPYYIESNGKNLTVQPGDWIVITPSGFVYRCANDAFCDAYEPV